MNTRLIYCAALAGLFSVSVPIALADTDKDAAGTQDQKFVDKAWNINTAEIRLGKIAQSNASNDDVREFGRQMVKDHQKLNDDLKNAAEQEGDTLPSDLDQQHTDLYTRLSNLSGSDFDKAYMDAMIKGHTKAIAAFEDEIIEPNKTPVEQWADQNISKIRMHAEMAHKTGKEVGAPAADDGAAAQVNDEPAVGK
jgi:putative membrane protein